MWFIEFLKNHLELVISCFILLLSVLMALIKKRPNEIIDSLTQAIFTLLPDYINLAEEKFGSGNGSKKKEYVLELIKTWAKVNHIELTDYYLDIASKFIELILNTPQKK